VLERKTVFWKIFAQNLARGRQAALPEESPSRNGKNKWK